MEIRAQRDALLVRRGASDALCALSVHTLREEFDNDVERYAADVLASVAATFAPALPSLSSSFAAAAGDARIFNALHHKQAMACILEALHLSDDDRVAMYWRRAMPAVCAHGDAVETLVTDGVRRVQRFADDVSTLLDSTLDRESRVSMARMMIERISHAAVHATAFRRAHILPDVIALLYDECGEVASFASCALACLCTQPVPALPLDADALVAWPPLAWARGRRGDSDACALPVPCALFVQAGEADNGGGADPLAALVAPLVACAPCVPNMDCLLTHASDAWDALVHAVVASVRRVASLHSSSAIKSASSRLVCAAALLVLAACEHEDAVQIMRDAHVAFDGDDCGHRGGATIALGTVLCRLAARIVEYTGVWAFDDDDGVTSRSAALHCARVNVAVRALWTRVALVCERRLSASTAPRIDASPVSALARVCARAAAFHSPRRLFSAAMNSTTVMLATDEYSAANIAGALAAVWVVRAIIDTSNSTNTDADAAADANADADADDISAAAMTSDHVAATMAMAASSCMSHATRPTRVWALFQAQRRAVAVTAATTTTASAVYLPRPPSAPLAVAVVCAASGGQDMGDTSATDAQPSWRLPTRGDESATTTPIVTRPTSAARSVTGSTGTGPMVGTASGTTAGPVRAFLSPRVARSRIVAATTAAATTSSVSCAALTATAGATTYDAARADEDALPAGDAVVLATIAHAIDWSVYASDTSSSSSLSSVGAALRVQARTLVAELDTLANADIDATDVIGSGGGGSGVVVRGGVWCSELAAAAAYWRQFM